MSKLLRLLKPYFLLILTILFFVILNVNLNLKIPEYTANIVNVGIARGGFDKEHLTFIASDSFAKLELNKEIENYFKDNYTLALKGSSVSILNQEIDLKKDAYILTGKGNSEFDKIFVLSKFKELNIQGAEDFDLKTSLNSMLINEYNDLGFNSTKVQNDYIISTGLKMLIFAISAAILIILSSFLAGFIGARVARKLRRRVYDKVLAFSNLEANKFGVSSLITRTTNDIENVRLLIAMGLRAMLNAVVLEISALMKLVAYPKVLSIIGGVIFIIGLFIVGASAFIIPRFKKERKYTDRNNQIIREFLSGVLVIRAFNQDQKEEERFNRNNKEVYRNYRAIQYTVSLIFPILIFAINIMSVIIIYFSATQIEQGLLGVGDIIAFTHYAMMMVWTFIHMSFMVFEIPRTMVSINRIYEVLDNPIAIVDGTSELIKKGDTILEFKDVCFKYPNASDCVIENINFSLKAKETIAFIGSTGSGKSSIINLIPRFYEATCGNILLYNQDIKDLKLEDLRDRIAFVPQKAQLLKGDIRMNLAMNKKLSDEELDKALKIASAYDFVYAKEGLDTKVAMNGNNFSGGQKQRLAIARALASVKDLLIFDDSFSALDFKTDALVRKNIKEYLKETNAACIIVGQRIGSIMDADRIYVLDEGRIVASGKHHELLKNCSIYLEIAKSQLSEKELFNEK